MAHGRGTRGGRGCPPPPPPPAGGGAFSPPGGGPCPARLAAEAPGLPRHLSQHSGGMIVSTRPLVDCCPIVPAAMEGRQIVQWDKDSCSDAGFLKIALLVLGCCRRSSVAWSW